MPAGKPLPRFSVSCFITLHTYFISAPLSVRLGDRSSQSSGQRKFSHWEISLFVPLSSYSGSQRVGSHLCNLPHGTNVYRARTHHVRRQ